MKFNEVAATYSEDKARSGVSYNQFMFCDSYNNNNNSDQKQKN